MRASAAFLASLFSFSRALSSTVVLVESDRQDDDRLRSPTPVSVGWRFDGDKILIEYADSDKSWCEH